ncbi:aluminum resistance family protein [Clostridium sp. CAG:762]|nr:aluminum resistance family protein [Clostridium sp. CAG:762]
MDKNKIIELVNSCEKECTHIFENINKIEYNNSQKVLDAFHEYHLQDTDFVSSTGYGYDDVGRDKIEKIFAHILGSEDALVRNQFISGTHALTVTLFGLLRPNDTMLSITGKPYDTLDEVIGIIDNQSSLKSYGINYEGIDLINDDFNYDQIEKKLKEKHIKLIEIQRSRGYSKRKSLTIDKLEKVISFIRKIDKNVIIMVDNCYCEFVEDKSPIEVGASIIVGSLIKNLGGGIASNGAYVAGSKQLISLVADRLTVPGQGKEVGPSLGANKTLLQGLFFAPSVVSSSVKVAILTSLVLEKLGFQVSPRYDEERADIVEAITFASADKLTKYIQGIQSASAIDAHVLPIPTDMPGYNHQIIMASGSFTQGSSIELSCDGPMKSPYIAYQQGSLTYTYGKLGLIKALEVLYENK